MSIKQEITKMIANGYAETHIGYHADYRSFEGSEFRRGAYAQIARPYGGAFRIYAPTYAALLAEVTLRISEGDL